MAEATSEAVRRVDPYGYETWTGKFSRKFKENPWVPIGCLATCGALVMSAVKMRAGKSQEMNHWMRARVGLQGLTLVALVAGSMTLQAQRKKELESPEAQLTQEEIKQQERAEFEERLRGAEEAHLQESGLVGGKMVVKGPATVKHAEQPPVLQPKSSVEPSALTPTSGSSRSWWKLW